MKISGTFCAALTPLNTDYSINHNVYFDHCNKLLSEGADGIAIFGTTGEANLLSIDAKIEAMQALIEKGFDPSKLIPGTGVASMMETIKLSKFAKQMQTAGVLMLPSFYYNNPTDQGVVDYYSKIIETVGDKQFKVLLYHIPKISGVSINHNIIESLISKYPDNVVGIKDSANDLNNTNTIIKDFPDFCVFSGSDSLALDTMRKGAAGAITATANISVVLLSFIVNKAKDETATKNLESAHILQDKIRNVVFSQEQISFMKAILKIKTKNNIWDTMMPPLVNLNNLEKNKNIIAIIKLLDEMNELSSNF